MINENNHPQRHTEDIEVLKEQNKKIAFCRCWQSNTFPYCDGSHRNHNDSVGDFVGPVIVHIKATSNTA